MVPLLCPGPFGPIRPMKWNLDQHCNVLDWCWTGSDQWCLQWKICSNHTQTVCVDTSQVPAPTLRHLTKDEVTPIISVLLQCFDYLMHFWNSSLLLASAVCWFDEAMIRAGSMPVIRAVYTCVGHSPGPADLLTTSLCQGAWAGWGAVAGASWDVFTWDYKWRFHRELAIKFM